MASSEHLDQLWCSRDRRVSDRGNRFCLTLKAITAGFLSLTTKNLDLNTKVIRLDATTHH